MRPFYASVAALLSLLLPLNARWIPFGTPVSFNESLEWTKNTINSYAQLHYQNLPSVEASTTWQVTGNRGCQLNVKEMFHRESKNNITTADGVMSIFEDENKTYSFNLADLKPKQIRSVTAETVPYIILSTATDMFQVHSEHVSKTIRSSGELKTSTAWNDDQRARSLWIYFGSAKTDNTKLVRDVERSMRTTIDYCRAARSSHSESE